MGERSKGKDEGKLKKSAKTPKTGRRPHEQQQIKDLLEPKRPQ